MKINQKQPKRHHTLTCIDNGMRKKVLLVNCPEKGGFWWTVKGGHTVWFTCGEPFLSGKHLSSVPVDDLFTYYGNGTQERPGNVADMETLLWLLRDK